MATRKKRYFFSYQRVMDELNISRRTLARWIDELDIQPMEIEDQMRVFLVLPHVEKLREYAFVMHSRSQNHIDRYRIAVSAGDKAEVARIKKELEVRSHHG